MSGKHIINVGEGKGVVEIDPIAPDKQKSEALKMARKDIREDLAKESHSFKNITTSRSSMIVCENCAIELNTILERGYPIKCREEGDRSFVV